MRHTLDIARSDSVRLTTMIDFASSIQYTAHPDTLHALGRQALELAETLLARSTNARDVKHYSENKAAAMRLVSQYHHLVGRSDSVLAWEKRVQDIYQSIDNKAGIALTRHTQAVTYRRLGDSKKARDLLRLAIAEFERNESLKSNLAYAWSDRAMQFMDAGQPDSALLSMDRSIQLHAALGDSSGLAHAKLTKGHLLLEVDQMEAAMHALMEAAELFVRLKEPQGEAICHNNMAKILGMQGLLEEGIEYQYRSLDICLSYGDKHGEAVNRRNLAASLFSSGQMKRALSEAEKTLRIAVELEMHEGISKAHAMLASIHLAEGRIPAANSHLRQALENAQRSANSHLLAESHTQLAGYHLTQGDLDSAAHHFRISIPMHERNGAVSSVAENLASLAEVHLQRNDLLGAHRHAERSFKTAMKTGFPATIARVSGIYGQVLKAMGRSMQAYDVGIIQMAMHDSVQGMDISRKTEAAHFRRELLQTQQLDSAARAGEVTALLAESEVLLVRAKERQRQEWSMGVGVIALLISGTLMFLLDRRRRHARQARAAAQLQAQAWRSQVNPRFIHTALQNIGAYVQANERDLASSFLVRFARLMRAVLENARQEEVTLAGDLAVLRDYLELERARTNNAFTYAVEVDPAIDPEEVMVPPMLLQPFAENAIWQGFARKGGMGAGHLAVTVRRHGAALLIAMEDDGGARPVDPPAGTPGSGDGDATEVVRSRLSLVARQQGGAAGVRAVALPHGTRVELHLPLMTAA